MPQNTKYGYCILSVGSTYFLFKEVAVLNLNIALLPNTFTIINSEDPDGMSHSAASHLGLHCSHMTYF